MKQFLLFTAVLVAFCSSISAQVTFTGDGDGISWDDPLNWDTGDVPQEGDDIIIFAATLNYYGSPFTYGSLELSNSSNLLIQGDLYLSGDITIDQTSILSTDAIHLNLIYKVYADSYNITGDIDILFSGYVPQIGNSFKVINASIGACGIATTDIVPEGQATGFQVYLGVECQFDGILHTVTDINYTTAKSWDGEAGDGQWTSAANWDPNGIPTSDDVVIINMPGGGIAGTVGAGTTMANQILVGDNNTLIINGDLEMFSVIQMSDAATMIWNAGTISKSDPNVTSTILNSGTIEINTNQYKSIDADLKIWNTGVINHNYGTININNGEIINSGEYNINGDNIAIGYDNGSNHSFINYSTISKTTGSGASSITLSNFVNYWRILSQSGVLVIGENIDSESGSFGGDGSTQFPNNYIYEGELSPGNSPGILTFIGNLTTAAEATFNIEIDGPNAGTEYDQILVTDEAVLDGDINVTLGYLPADDASFEIVVAGTLTSCNFPSQVTSNFNGTDYTFDVVCQNNTLYLNGPGATLSQTDFDVEALNIHPNPTQNNLSIRMQSYLGKTWVLYTQLGQKVLEGNLVDAVTNVDLKHLPSGVFLLQIKDENNSSIAIKRIIKD